MHTRQYHCGHFHPGLKDLCVCCVDENVDSTELCCGEKGLLDMSGERRDCKHITSMDTTKRLSMYQLPVHFCGYMDKLTREYAKNKG